MERPSLYAARPALLAAGLALTVDAEEAERLELPADIQERVRMAAFLHDLGKVGVPTDLLLRAGELVRAEAPRSSRS